MGTLFMATADTRTLTVFGSTSALEVSSTYARTGTYSFRATGVSGQFRQGITATASPPYVRVAVLSTNTTYFEIRFREGETNHTTVRCDFASGTIYVARHTTSLMEGGVAYSANLQTGVWYVLEVKTTIHDSTGTCTVKLNGAEIIALSSKDTRNSGTGLCDNIFVSANSSSVYFDDIMFRDDDWCGQGGIYVLTPTGASGADAGWTASAGDPHECVDEVPATFTDNIYADADTPGTKHNFAMSDLGGVYTSIPTVGVVALAKLSAAGSGSIKVYGESDGTESAGSAVALDVSGVWATHYMDANPDGDGAWDKTGVNALLAGVVTA